MEDEIVLRPIGWVRSGQGGPSAGPKGGSARIDLLPEVREGLLGIAPGDKLLVLFWMDRAERGRLQVHPRGEQNRPLRGVFATRSPHRPNPIGATVVTVLSVDQKEGTLIVEGLDAFDGSPVLDIKEQSPRFDNGS